MVRTEDPKTQTIALLKGYGPFSFREKQSAIIDAVMWSGLYNGGHRPGEAVKHLPKDIRNTLKECKSRDWNHRVK